MACAKTVAVVVPSPAVSDVLLATSFTILAPMFWKWSSRSISLATVTPSLVTVGAPNDLARTPFRPFGPCQASKENSIPPLQFHRGLCPILLNFALPYRNDLSFHGLFLSRVRENNPTFGLLFFLKL